MVGTETDPEGFEYSTDLLGLLDEQEGETQ